MTLTSRANLAGLIVDVGQADLGFGHIGVSEIEAPNTFVNLV